MTYSVVPRGFFTVSALLFWHGIRSFQYLYLQHFRLDTDLTSEPCLEVDIFIGLEVIGEIEGDGFLEGGDFTPAGQDLALLGIGLRSNMEAAQQLMDKDLLGSRRFAVVRDDFEQHQVGIPL